MENAQGYPRVATMGVTAMLVTFGDTPQGGANRAARAFRAAVDAAGWNGVEETTVSLTSTMVSFDPLRISHAEIRLQIDRLLAERDWGAVPNTGRRHWRIPAVFGGAAGPQLAEAAALAGTDEAGAIAAFCSAPIEVLTLGFAPGQPYLGMLPDNWDIARQTALTPQVPQGAIVVAVRQLIIFTNPAPTGWRHVGQCGFRTFQPDASPPMALRAGDQVSFLPVSEAELAAHIAADSSGMAGASVEAIP
ncbi:carboxyltransferase domain-containing protein [Phaeobacter sp. J2-8]|uniref:5-oxoprolinase subunit B family protein n=1 Tax=Phaeobacter sp. J2-8 TaxID=2931394 RepID=UPI001FD4B232|nr:carboxyltransferase domain-containing protein [Phaeobacter sp. J2-8]MCJ7871888.1 allophanate hydrolase subunit 1 [Phaeobacter sp. J2-8]